MTTFFCLLTGTLEVSLSTMDLIEEAIKYKIIKTREEATGTQYNMVTSETVSRLNCLAGILTMNSSLNVRQTPQTERRYDMWTVSGDTTVAIETKDRKCRSDSFEDFGLSKSKYDMLRAIDVTCGGRAVWYANTFQDGKLMIWDVNEAPCTIRPWSHNKYTEKSGRTITEDAVYFKPSDAKYIVKYDRM